MISLLVLLFFSISSVILWYKWIFSNPKNNILIQLDVQYSYDKDYTLAIVNHLIEQGRQVQFLGNRRYLVDGQNYILHEISIPIGASLSTYPILKKE